MNWRDELVDRLVQNPYCGYGKSDRFATEPSALSALALAGAGQIDGSNHVAQKLKDLQAPNGSVGVREGEREPCWTTSLAVLAWMAMREIDQDESSYVTAVDRAVGWILGSRGLTHDRQRDLGHDCSIPAWPWVDGTHAWVEPSALHVLALKATGHGAHARARDAVHMLLDRQLPQGGWNYGNTFVLGRPLRAHLQPTGIALLALAGETDTSSRHRQSVQYLLTNVSARTSTTSLCWGLLALAAYRLTPRAADSWLESAFHRTLQRDQSALKLALIALALQKEEALVVKLPKKFLKRENP